MTAELDLKLRPERNVITELTEAVESFGVDQNWSPKLVFQVQLVLEELVLNVIDYGFKQSGENLSVRILSSADSLRIDLADDAPPFDPIGDAPETDPDELLENRQIGGLGLHLVRTMMDQVQYLREDGQNRLTLVKRRGA